MKADRIFRFLKDICVNNDREWFNAHRSEYDEARAEFEYFLAVVIGRISIFDKSVSHLQPKDCTYRIYRDLRFTEDKTPYKTHFGGYINAHGRKSAHSGYYMQLEPGNCMLCSGSICVTSDMLKALRHSVYDNIDEFREIVEDPAFKRFFPTIGFDRLKMAPKGFPKDFPYMEYLKVKDYGVCMQVPDSYFYQPDLLDQLDEVFRQMQRMNDFVNATIDEME